MDDTVAPSDVAAYDHRLARLTIGGAQPLAGRIVIEEYEPRWPRLYAREAERIRGALGERVVLLEHVGSTSVPGLAAKPIIDIVLEVPDSSAEPDYVPPLERAGYVRRIREPEWFEHRVFKGSDTSVNLRVFSVGASERQRMLSFRDRPRQARVAARDWKYVQQYADAKREIVREILGRASEAGQPDGP